MNFGLEVYSLEASFLKVVLYSILMENIVHIVRNIPKEDLMDIVNKVFEDVNFEAIMDNDEDALSEDGDYNSGQSKNQSEDTKSKIVYPEDVIAMNVLTK